MSNETRIVITADGKAAIDGLNAVTQKLKETTDQAKTSSKSMVEGWRDYATAINQSFGVLGTAAGVLKDIYKTAKEGAELAEQRQQFTALAASYGVYADAVIEASRRATTGQVADAELIANTMAAMRQNVSRNQNELAKLWEIAEVKSDQFGGTVSENFRKITDAIATGNGRSLVSLGLLPESMGRASSAAQLLERRGKLLSDVFTQFGEDTETAAAAGDSSADSFNRLESGVKNLADAFKNELGPAAKDVIDYMVRGINAADMAARRIGLLNQKNPYIGLSVDETRAKLDMAQGSLSSLTLPGIKGVSEKTRLDNMGTLDNEVRLLQEALKINKQLSDATRNNDLWAEYDERVRGLAKSHDKAGKGAKGHKEAVESLSKAMREAFGAAQEYAQANDAERLRIVMEDLARQAEAFADALGVSKLEPIRGMLVKLAGSAGLLAENLQSAYGWLSGGAGKTVTGIQGWLSNDVVGSRYEGMLKNAASSWWKASSPKSALESTFGDIESFVSTFYNAFTEPSGSAKESQDKFRDTFKDAVAGSFEAGLNEAILNGDDFFKAFGDALKRQLVNALAQSISSSIFSTSTGTAQGYTSGSGTIYKFISDGIGSFFGKKPIGPNDVAVDSTSSRGSLFGSLFKSGNLVQSVGTSLAVGYAVNKLFGQGGLFGGRVIHGAEAINQAADINTQVRQAADQRGQYLGMMGVSQGTYDQLRDLQFWNAGYTWSKSGDGIFSKKTTTYALDSARAQEALDKYAKLIAQATAEAAAREYEKQFAAIKNPAEALKMTIEDLKEVIKRGTDANGTVYTDTAKQAQLQLLQIQAAQKSNAIARAGDWFSFMIQNPYSTKGKSWDPFSAMFGEDPGSIYETGMQRYINPTIAEPQTKLTLSGGKYGVGGTLQGEEISTWVDQMAMMSGLKTQYKKAYDLQSLAMDPSKSSEYLTEYKKLLDEQMSVSDDLSKAAEAKLKDLSLATEERTAAFQEWQEAQNAYYTAKLNALQIEKQQQAAIKAKQDALTTDILGTLSTRIGEVSENAAGQKIIILSNGQPEGKTLATQLRDAVAGTDPELAKLLTDFLAAAGTRWN